MTLEIPSEYEGVLNDAVASGAFATPQDALRHALATFAKERASNTGQQFPDTPPRPIRQMPKTTDVEELARKQGVQPLKDFRQLEASFWPADESVDDFIQAIREGRQDDGARTR
ncbi:hypothetical protein [Novipirellula rosea]|uniref:Ribbon-helix-helix protein CopG domain-containing protein n=1 Tax=Novipirellula rosea TaxID=1031540 RepID=A0ABP8ND28_9BACT|tara:strand:+ start:6743 stop:7084 length:342 start_codon:yes stop_codon:yes gene_type:complete